MTIGISAFVLVLGLGIHYVATGKTQSLGIVAVFVGLFWLVSTLSHVSLSVR